MRLFERSASCRRCIGCAGSRRPRSRQGIPGGLLYGVSAVSASDAWAVGTLGSTGAVPLIMHWNGTTWSRVPSPSPGQLCQPCGQLVNELDGVAIISRSDAWAVGAYTTTAAFAALTLHWNGTKWVRVPNQDGTSDTRLTGVSMVVGDRRLGRRVSLDQIRAKHKHPDPALERRHLVPFLAMRHRHRLVMRHDQRGPLARLSHLKFLPTELTGRARGGSVTGVL